MPSLNEKLPEPYWRSPDGKHVLYHADCLTLIHRLGKFDAVVTDPPYGIGEAAGKNKSRGNLAVAKDYGDHSWDNIPVSENLMRKVVSSSKKAIIFGGNYYNLGPTKCYLVWDKENGENDFADCELAWTNLDKAVRRIRHMWNGMLRKDQEPRGDHPTQKPVGVMLWCLKQLPQESTTIIDPFAGSGTTGVASIRLGFKFVGIERVDAYCKAAARRMQTEWDAQERLRVAKENYKRRQHKNPLFEDEP